MSIAIPIQTNTNRGGYHDPKLEHRPQKNISPGSLHRAPRRNSRRCKCKTVRRFVFTARGQRNVSRLRGRRAPILRRDRSSRPQDPFLYRGISFPNSGPLFPQTECFSTVFFTGKEPPEGIRWDGNPTRCIPRPAFRELAPGKTMSKLRSNAPPALRRLRNATIHKSPGTRAARLESFRRALI